MSCSQRQLDHLLRRLASSFAIAAFIFAHKPWQMTFYPRVQVHLVGGETLRTDKSRLALYAGRQSRLLGQLKQKMAAASVSGGSQAKEVWCHPLIETDPLPTHSVCCTRFSFPDNQPCVMQEQFELWMKYESDAVQVPLLTCHVVSKCC